MSDEILAAIAALDGKLSTQLTALDGKLNETRAAIMERIDRLQNRFDQTRVEVNAGFNNAARIEDKTTALQAELRAMVEQDNHLTRRLHAMDTRLQALEDKGGR